MKIIYGVTLHREQDKTTVIFGSEKRAAEFAEFIERHAAVNVSCWSKESK